jgi:hypothetical protein
MLTDLIQKVFGNKEIADTPFPVVPVHTHNSIDSPALAPGSVSTVNIKPDAVDESKLMDLSVTEEKLAEAAVATQKIKDDAITAAKVWKGGSVITLSAQIAEAIILTAHIQDLAVKWAKIGNLEVGNSKIMDAAISNAKIQDLSVTNGKIGLLEVGNSRIMDAAISTAKIQDLAVEWAQIATLAVGNSKIMNAAISTAKIQNLAVTDAEVNDLNAAKISAGLMTADRIWGGSAYFDYIQVRECGTQAVNVAGNINKSGTCNFAIPHPFKPGKQLVYTGIESAEVMLVERGSSLLQNGQKRIDFSDHFKAVSDPRKTTAYLTPREDCKGLLLQETTADHITVKEMGNGKSNAKFDYIIFTVRKGFYGVDFEPEDLSLFQNDGEDEDSFKQRYHDHRIKLIQKKGGPDVDKKIAEFHQAWISTQGNKKVNQKEVNT